jgi:hypothetical protein
MRSKHRVTQHTVYALLNLLNWNKTYNGILPELFENFEEWSKEQFKRQYGYKMPASNVSIYLEELSLLQLTNLLAHFIDYCNKSQPLWNDPRYQSHSFKDKDDTLYLVATIKSTIREKKLLSIGI